MKKIDPQVQNMLDVLAIVRAQGGVTVRDDGRLMVVVSSGCVVSPYKDWERRVSNLTLTKLARYAYDHCHILREPDHCLGVWRNPDDGLYYLDVVVVVRTREEAALLAGEHDQIAYFDLDTMEEVRPEVA